MAESLSSLENQRAKIRTEMRAKRKSLSENQQLQAANHILPQALDLINHTQAQNIALYLPFQGEISPLVLMRALLSQGKQCYLPVLHPFSPNHLLFVEYRSEQDLQKNRFGILEPKLDVRRVRPLKELEMIFVPLVACDYANNRLGMGGGFYDRTLSLAPHLISVGLAHQFQQIEQLPIEPWDIPLKHLILG